MATAREIIGPASEAFGLTSEKFIEQLGSWCEEHGRSGHRHANTIQENLENPQRKASLNFVLGVLDFLHANTPKATKPDSLEAAKVLCRNLLAADDAVRNRYTQTLHSEPGRSETFMEDCTGVYVICRRETSTQDYCQELLILREVGRKRKRERFATYIGTEAVYRGTWASIGNALYVATQGYRSGHKPDIITLLLAMDDQHGAIRGGLLAGLTTAGGRDPASMPVIAIKAKTASSSMLAIGDLADEYLLPILTTPFRQLTSAQRERLDGLKDYFQPIVIDAKDKMIAQLRGATREY